MTERELRDSLETHLAPADLPDRRKQALLAALREEAAPAISKGDAPMFRPNKLRTVLVAALMVTLLSATIAVAAGFSGYVNFKGQPVDDTGVPVPSPMPAEEEAREEDYRLALRMDAILNASPRDQLTRVTLQTENTSSGSWMQPSMTVNSLEELTALLPEEVILPQTPEGYAFSNALVYFDCAAGGAYELVRDETHDDGITIKGYRIAENKRVPSSVSYRLCGKDGDISISISLERGAGYHFRVDNALSVEPLDIPGIEDAILIIKPNAARLTMQRKLNQPIPVVDPVTLHGRPDAPDMTLTHLVISLYSATVPADVLLSMYR